MSNPFGSEFVKDEIGVWLPTAGRGKFGYSDGRWVERYLERVFRESSDLSSGSEELESYIKDWNTEYHLTRKRKDLLAGLIHQREAKVLEIGCGCGAITRYLGEQYDSVVAVEGSYERARLARLRTSDLSNVEVIASPYQHIGMEGKFDIVFCIGVLEYAPTYVDGDQPFDIALESMRRMLKPGGTIVIAIENQYGLKYFANSREDHSGTFFEGIEGYPRTSHAFQTFGRKALSEKLKKYWKEQVFCYPFPDYKLPSALVSEQAFTSLDCGELLSSMYERDYAGRKPSFFDTRLSWPSIVKNGLAHEMSNSFLVIAGSESKLAPSMGNKLAVLFNRDRRAAYCTETVVEIEDGQVIARKLPPNGETVETELLRLVPNATCWLNDPTVAYEMFRRLHSPVLEFSKKIEPIKRWWAYIQSCSSLSGEEKYIPGTMIDAIWHNACLADDGSIQLFDLELEWKSDIPVRELFIRAAYQWLVQYRKPGILPIEAISKVSTIKRLAHAININIHRKDIDNFLKREALLQNEIGMTSYRAAKMKIWFQLHIPYADQLISTSTNFKLQYSRVRNYALRIIGR